MASCYIGCVPPQNQQQQLLLPNQVVPSNDLVDAITALSELRHALVKAGAPRQQTVNKQGNASSRQKHEFFPSVLHQILADESLNDIITWLPNGESFCVLKPDKFVSVIEKYFGGESSVKYASFTRKLNRWGFRQLTKGPQAGAFHHHQFRRDAHYLCLNMVCRSRRGQKANWTPRKTETSPQPLPLQAKIVDDAIIMPRHQTASRETTTNYISDSSGWSTASSVSCESCTSSSSVVNQDRIIKILYQDKKLLALATKKQEEAERMRAARAMLYTAFLKAL